MTVLPELIYALQKCSIYEIKNKTTGRVYIGRARTVKERLSSHRYNLRANKHVNKLLQSDWNKYGEDDFVFSIIEKVGLKYAHEMEMKWIQSYTQEESYNIVGVKRLNTKQAWEDSK